MLAVVAPAEGGVGKPRGAAALRARGCLPSRRSAGARFLRYLAEDQAKSSASRSSRIHSDSESKLLLERRGGRGG